ncbi:hypothetical protein CDD83_2467 [Cordyceps sp. RAO-2017]|nr:hypothetical protein CDD83_2467 [Cordyceps sp. RAO-2017]
MILSAILLAGFASLPFGQALRVRTEPGHACGLEVGQCPDKTRCVPSRPDCLDLGTCAGTCEPWTRFPSCGGHTVRPHLCSDDATCIDDPRFPNSCGMACDVPGICVANDVPRCTRDKGNECPDGLSCYDVPRDGCDPLKGDTGCQGICM